MSEIWKPIFGGGEKLQPGQSDLLRETVNALRRLPQSQRLEAASTLLEFVEGGDTARRTAGEFRQIVDVCQAHGIHETGRALRYWKLLCGPLKLNMAQVIERIQMDARFEAEEADHAA